MLANKSRLLLIFVFALILFCCTFWMPYSFTHFLRLASGSLLALFFPGFFFNRIFFQKIESKLSVISFSILSSIAIFGLFNFLLKSHIGFSSIRIFALIIAINIGLFAITLFKKIDYSLGNSDYNKIELVLIFLPLILFGLGYFVSPYVSEGDSYYYIYEYLNSLKLGHDAIPWIHRPAFTSIITLLNLGVGFKIATIFRIVLTVLFYISFLFVFDFCRLHAKSTWLTGLAYLGIFATCIVPSEVDITRFQLIVIIYTLPTLYLLSQAVEQRSYSLIALAFLYSMIAGLSHELGFVLLGASVIGLLILAISDIRKRPQLLTPKNIALLFIIILPYILLVRGRIDLSTIVGLTQRMSDYILHPQFHLWFISHYTTIDGKEIGWPGIQSILYYLYNGGLFLIFVIFLAFVSKRQERKKILFPFLLFAFYFAIAEILPRIGFFAYPNRAWPHLMLGLYLIFIPLFLKNSLVVKSRLIQIAALGIIIVGSLGWFYVSFNKGGLFTKEDHREIPSIKTLPENAIVFSSQGANRALVSVYGEKRFEDINLPTDKLSLVDQVNLQVATINKKVKSSEEKKTELCQIQSENGEILKSTTRPLPLSSMGYRYIKNEPLYFYYSFARFDGMLGSRDWWQADNDVTHKAFFQNYSGPDVVYKDAQGILIKINHE